VLGAIVAGVMAVGELAVTFSFFESCEATSRMRISENHYPFILL
jgi:hypothetical protein